jgi:hypothetical protein
LLLLEIATTYFGVIHFTRIFIFQFVQAAFCTAIAQGFPLGAGKLL